MPFARRRYFALINKTVLIKRLIPHPGGIPTGDGIQENWKKIFPEMKLHGHAPNFSTFMYMYL